MVDKNISLFPELEKDLRALGFMAGVLPSQQIEALIKDGCICSTAPIGPDQIQPASLDLRLGPVAFRVRASFLPGTKSTVSNRIDVLQMHAVDLSRPAVLERGCVYVVPLLEELNLPPRISAKANPKSTTGRLDIFTRLLTDYSDEFERVQEGYKGKLFVEIVPRTFSILVHQGTKLNQLRFLHREGTGAAVPTDAKLEQLNRKETLVYRANDQPEPANISEGLWISIDLQGVNGSEIVGYRARHHAPLIDLDKVGHYDPIDFWDPIRRPAGKGIILHPDDFYILLSKQKIRIPSKYAAEMVAYDPSVGEFRIHYAGFFDPGFGYGRDDIKGTHAVLEVRSHEVPFLLEDGQVVGRLIYEKLLAVPEKIYGTGIGSSYQGQGLSLSKQFKRG